MTPQETARDDLVPVILAGGKGAAVARSGVMRRRNRFSG